MQKMVGNQICAVPGPIWSIHEQHHARTMIPTPIAFKKIAKPLLLIENALGKCGALVHSKLSPINIKM
jgi:hypothetical protein